MPFRPLTNCQTAPLRCFDTVLHVCSKKEQITIIKTNSVPPGPLRLQMANNKRLGFAQIQEMVPTAPTLKLKWSRLAGH